MDQTNKLNVSVKVKMREQKECMHYIDSLKYGGRKEDICKFRTRYCIEWYSRKAITYKRAFIILSIINVAIPQISTIVVLQSDCSLTSAIMSAIVSVSASLLALLNVKDRWTSYRTAVEFIKKQYTLYCVRAVPFQGDDAHSIYLNMIEQYMTEEHGHWVDMQRESPAKDDIEAQKS